MNEKILFSLIFDDGSKFILPKDWEPVFIDYFGQSSENYQRVTERLQFVVGKYMQHRAWPTKFDGILHENSDDDCKYDDPAFYSECWDDWEEARKKWGLQTIVDPPTKAEICDAVLYQHMRGGLMQQALNQMAKKKGIRPPRVVTPEQFLEELELSKVKV